MKKLIPLFFIIVLSCNSSDDLSSKIDLDSVKSYLVTTWFPSDSTASVDSLNFLRIDSISDKQRLKENIDHWNTEMDKITDSLEPITSLVESQRKVVRLSGKFKLRIKSTNAELASNEKKLEALVAKRQTIQSKLSALNTQLSTADSLIPIGYRTKYSFQLKSGTIEKKDSSIIFLDKDFKAISREAFYKQ